MGRRGQVEPGAPRLERASKSCGPSGCENRVTISSLAAAPLRATTAPPSRSGAEVRPSRSPHAVNCVKHITLSSSATISSSSSSVRVSFPDRPDSLDPSPRKCAGWLHTCFSRSSPARTAPRRSIPSTAPRHEQVVDDGLVQRRLLARQRAPVDRLDLLGEVADDRPVGLDPTQHERSRDTAQQSGASSSCSCSIGRANRSRNERADPSSPGLRN